MRSPIWSCCWRTTWRIVTDTTMMGWSTSMYTATRCGARRGAMMSNNLYIAATEPMSGKSLVALGLMELLSRRQARLGFFRPVIARADRPDNDIRLIAERYGLEPGVTAVHAFTHDEAQRELAAGRHDEVLKAILERYKQLES